MHLFVSVVSPIKNLAIPTVIPPGAAMCYLETHHLHTHGLDPFFQGPLFRRPPLLPVSPSRKLWQLPNLISLVELANSFISNLLGNHEGALLHLISASLYPVPASLPMLGYRCFPCSICSNWGTGRLSCHNMETYPFQVYVHACRYSAAIS